MAALQPFNAELPPPHFTPAVIAVASNAANTAASPPSTPIKAKAGSVRPPRTDEKVATAAEGVAKVTKGRHQTGQQQQRKETVEEVEETEEMEELEEVEEVVVEEESAIGDEIDEDTGELWQTSGSKWLHLRGRRFFDGVPVVRNPPRAHASMPHAACASALARATLDPLIWTHASLRLVGTCALLLCLSRRMAQSRAGCRLRELAARCGTWITMTVMRRT